jgi:hypothetical protein
MIPIYRRETAYSFAAEIKLQILFSLHYWKVATQDPFSIKYMINSFKAINALKHNDIYILNPF